MTHVLDNFRCLACGHVFRLRLRIARELTASS